MSTFPNPGHVAVTVSDLSVSRSWYGRLFGMVPVVDEDTGPYHHVVWAFPNGILFGIHFFPDGKSDPFEERRPGLDHVAFNVKDRAALEEWERRLDEMGIERGRIVDIPAGSALAFRDPDGIQLEFWANAPR